MEAAAEVINQQLLLLQATKGSRIKRIKLLNKFKKGAHYERLFLSRRSQLTDLNRNWRQSVDFILKKNRLYSRLTLTLKVQQEVIK